MKPRILHRLLLLATTAALSWGLAAPCPAMAAPKAVSAKTATQADNETLISADHMMQDQNKNLLIAEGHVEIAREGYILQADRVTYNQSAQVARAEGHVVMLTPSGEVQFAESEEVTGDLKQAFAENISILFPDHSRLAARSVQRYEGRYAVADKGVYTSCNVCRENPDKLPLWQVRAQTITHDNVEHDIYYRDATLDFMGVPVLYTPYLSSPDPTVKRRQGLLTVTPGTSPTLGGFVRVPYYFDIAPDMDAVLAPTFSVNDKAQFGGSFRKRFANGSLDMDGSFTRADLISDTGIDRGQQWRGHFFGAFLYNIDNVWRAGTDINFTSDKSYLQRYRITSADNLVSRAYIEGFQGRNFASVNAYAFEDLRPGTQQVQPFVLPQAKFSALGEPGQTLGGRWSLDGGMLVTSRDNANQALWQQGPNTRRLNLAAGWDRRLISNTGLVTDLNANFKANAYWADNVISTDGSNAIYNDVVMARQFEQASATMSYPLMRNGDGYQHLIEPVLALTAAPDVTASSKQPNEDSLNVQFDETNLFASNRFNGNDLFEGGNRATYGLRQSVTSKGGARMELFGGQSYNFSRNDNFPGLSGLRNHWSDYVGRLDLKPTDWFEANYGFRLDHDTLEPQFQDARLSVGTRAFRPYIRYISGYHLDTNNLTSKVDEIIPGFNAHFAKYWDVTASHVHVFNPQPGPRTTTVGLSYTDECLIFGVTVAQDNTTRADTKSGTAVVFHLFLKNLGGAHTDSATGGTFSNEFRQTD